MASLKDFESLANNKKSLFWAYTFGFVNYDTMFNKLFKIERVEKNFEENAQSSKEQQKINSQLRYFVSYLDDYRSRRNPKSLQQLDFEQVLHLSENSSKDKMLSLCVLLDEKRAKLNSLDFEESSSDQDSNTEQPDEQADNSQRDLDGQQFSFLENLYDLDKPFFYYIRPATA